MSICTYRVGPRKKQRVVLPSRKKLSKETVFEMVREIVLQRKARAEHGLIPWNLHVTAEELSDELQVDVHKVVWALHRCNLMGLVEQRRRHFAHDSRRDPMGWGNDSGWAANQYFIILPQEPIKYKPVVLRPIHCPKGCVLVWDEQEPKRKPRYSKRLRRRVVENVC